MAALNKVLLIGNLTRDPELRYTQNGSAVCEIGMAINRTYMSNNEKKEDVCYVDVNVWGRSAEACSRYLKKGSSLFVEGRLNFDQWTDKDSGKTRSKLKVVAERTQFLSSGGRSEDGEMNNSYGNSGSSGGGTQFGSAPVATNNTGSFPAPPPPQQFGANPQSSPATAPAQAPAPAVVNAPPPPVAVPVATPVAAPAPVATAPAAAPQQAPKEAFNPNMGSEDDIPF